MSMNKIGAGAWCPDCVESMSESLNELINIILNVGVLGSCSDLCGLLQNQAEAEICNLVCDIVGVEAFVDLLQDADPDPIWLCEELTVCPINDNAAAQITAASVSPSSGPTGTTFNINVQYTVTNQIGTGELALLVTPPDAMPFGDGALLVAVPPGQYGGSFQLQAQPSEQEPFDAGQYLVTLALCEGSCGSTHSHSFLLSAMNTTFTITSQ